MSLRTSPWPAGVPCWADLTVTDVPAAAPFYSAVLGWSFSEPDQEFGGYVIGSVKGAAAAGIGLQQQAGAPAAWTLYFASDDADGTARAVKEAGAEILLEPDDVGPLGRMFIGADPSRAVFGVWQGRGHIGAGVANEPGGLCWEDLRSADPDAARAFYSTLFGYTYEGLEAAGPDYTLFFSLPGEGPLGGMGGLTRAPAGTSSHLGRLLRGRRRPCRRAARRGSRRHGSDRALRDALRAHGRPDRPRGGGVLDLRPRRDRAARP